jgi:drug/metabolite transporter (DMT)-like permease
MTDNKRQWTVYGVMLVTTLFWALGHPLGRIILRTVHPFQLGAINLVVGLLTLVGFLAATGRLSAIVRLPARDLFESLALGALGFALYQVLTFSALSRIPASINAVLVATNVVLIAPLAAVFLGERIRWQGAVAIACAFGGVVLVTFNQGMAAGPGISLVGCLFSLLAALCFALYTVIGKKVVQRNDPLIVTALALFAGAVLLGAFTGATVGFRSLADAGGRAWVLMVLLGVTMIGFAYPAWFACLKQLPATRVSIFIYLTPVFAVVLSFFILDERFTWLFYVGGALVLGSVVVATTRNTTAIPPQLKSPSPR